MDSRVTEISRYEMLNKKTPSGATVIFGNARDLMAPVNAVREYFCIGGAIVNRSFRSLSVREADGLYMSCVAPINPSRVLIRLSDEVMDEEFDRCFVNLVSLIGSKVEIGILAGDDSAINEHLKALCDSCRVTFCDPEAAGCDLDTLRDLYASGLRSTVSLTTLTRMLYNLPGEAMEETVTAGARIRRTFSGFFRYAEAR